jgi:hypothetical protein
MTTSILFHYKTVMREGADDVDDPSVEEPSSSFIPLPME